MPDSRLTGMTDQRLGIPVLPLTHFLFPPVMHLATTVAVALPSAVSTDSDLASGHRTCRLSSSLARWGSLLLDRDNFGNSSRNECVFTPLISKVNKIIATISHLFSIECSSSTGMCQNFVQCENCSLASNNFTHYFRGFETLERSVRCEFQLLFNCGNLAEILSRAAFSQSRFFARAHLAGYG